MLKMIAIEDLYTTKNIRPLFDNEISSLAESIRQNGLLQPLVVQARENGKYEIICGHRRYAALKYIGEPVVECNVITLTENRTIVQLIENTQRREMLPWELTAAFDELKKKHGLTNLQLAASLGKTESWIMNQYTQTRLLEKEYGKDVSKRSKDKAAKLFSEYTLQSKAKNEIVRTYPDGTKVCYLLKSSKRKRYKYKLEFTSDTLRTKLENLLEQETRI